MSSRATLLTPVGRLVQGSLYVGQTTDAENRPLVYKTGANAGQPRVNFWFSIAIEKKQETHWNQTEWGATIWNAGHQGFPNGAANAPTFAWKVVDGDSTIPNTQGVPPCSYEGFPGHWVLKFSGAFAPSLFNHDGTKALLEVNAINLGDYVQVYGTVEDNKSTQRPGVYLNHSMIALSGYGARILVGADPKNVGFGKAALPAGASSTPLSVFTPPVPMPLVPSNGTPVAMPLIPTTGNPVPLPSTPVPASVNVAPPIPQPYPAILNPQSIRYETLPAANGATVEQLLAAGWTHELLIQHNMIKAY